MEHLEEMDVQFLLSKNTWEGIKKAKVVSFHSVNDVVDIVNHTNSCILHDRLLRKVLSFMRDSYPWKDSDRFFAKRPARSSDDPTAMAIKFAKLYHQDELDSVVARLKKLAEDTRRLGTAGARITLA